MKTLTMLMLLASMAWAQSIYDQYYQQCRKIAEAMTLEQRLGQTVYADFQAITEKEKEITNPDEAVSLNLGALLISGNAAPTATGNIAKVPGPLEEAKMKAAYLLATEENWKKLTDRFQSIGISVATKDSKYKIKLLLGTDAVHGDTHTIGSVLFPHNIGLSCTHNQENFGNLGYWTRQAVKRVGFNSVFAPTVAVSHSQQWGRYYESLGQEDTYIRKYAYSFVSALQNSTKGKTIEGVLATAKHFFGDGSTLYGTNQGNANVLNFEKYIDHNVPGYLGAAQADVGSTMVSLSAINWVPNSMNSQFLLGLLRQDIKFAGFTVSDYDEVVAVSEMLLPRTFMNLTEEDGYATMVNAGVDMFMVSSRAIIERIYKFAKKVYERDHVLEQRLVEAVTRILTVKMAMGLIEKLQIQHHSEMAQETPEIRSGFETQKTQEIREETDIEVNRSPITGASQYEDSLAAVRQSLVLLKNSNVLPVRNLFSSIKYVVLVGEKIHNLNRLTKIQLFQSYDNIGMQCGGWSVRWQGWEGNDFWTGDLKAKANASSILDALKAIQKINNMEIIFPNYTSLTNEVSIEEDRVKYLEALKTKRKDMNSKNTLIIGVFGEFPYAESVGDVNIPYCKIPDAPGCLYNPEANTYAPLEQAKTLNVQLSKFETDVIDSIKTADKTIPLISVLLSGRPLLINDLFARSDALIAAWLPGTSGGQGIVDAISGSYLLRPKEFSQRNSLSMDWPSDMNSLSSFPIYGSDGVLPRLVDPLFTFGYGLSTAGNGALVEQ